MDYKDMKFEQCSECGRAVCTNDPDTPIHPCPLKVSEVTVGQLTRHILNEIESRFKIISTN